MLLNNQWITEEIKEEIKIYLETNENESMTVQNLQGAAKAVLREVYSNTILPQETRKITNNLSLHLKQLKKNKQNQKLVEGKTS